MSEQVMGHFQVKVVKSQCASSISSSIVVTPMPMSSRCWSYKIEEGYATYIGF